MTVCSVSRCADQERPLCGDALCTQGEKAYNQSVQSCLDPMNGNPLSLNNSNHYKAFSLGISLVGKDHRKKPCEQERP